MQLQNVNESVKIIETYLSRCQDKNQSIEILKLAVLFDLSESLKTISESLSDPDFQDGVIDMFQRVYGSIDDLTESISEDFEQLNKKL